MDFFQNICFTERSNMVVEKNRATINLRKKMSSSYHMESKTWNKARRTNGIHTEEKVFRSWYFLRFLISFFLDRVKNL